MSKESKLMKNTIMLAIGNICTKCISFFMLPLYTSILSTSEYGDVDLVSTYVSLLIIIMTLQFEQGVFRFLIDSRNNENKKINYITTTIFSIFIVNLIFVILFFPLLKYINYQYTYYLLTWVVIGSFTAILLQIPRGIGENIIYVIGSFISGSSNVILNVIFVAVLRYGTGGMLSASVISLLLTTIFLCIKLKLWKYIKISYFDKNCFKNLVKYSLPLIPSTLCWWIINASDRMIINFALGTVYNGIYAAAYKFPSLFSMISNIFQLSWTESASENVNDSGRDKFYDQILNKAIKFYSSCNIFIISVLPFIFNFLIKKDFAVSYYYIPILMTAALFHSIASLYGSIYFAFKKTNEVALTTVVSAIINIVINIMFIYVIGLYAAAISSVLAYFAIIIIRHIDLGKEVKINISKKYLFCETFIYVIVFISYYLRISIIQGIVLLTIIPYCIYQNKDVIIKILNKMKQKLMM